jgi:hypothetical protein
MFTRLSHNLAARRPWLLLWVLPYLLLAVAGESLHDHGFGEQSKAPAAFLAQSVDTSTLGDDHQHALSSTEGCAQPGSAHSLPHCLSCQWSSQSVGVPAATASANPGLGLAHLALPLERAFVSSSMGITSTRGPPLS